jgi:nitrogen regulatory protein PII
MAYLVVFVVDDPDECTTILESWEAVGVTGVTILESTGLGRMKRAGLRDDLPLMPSIRDLLQTREVHHRTLLSVVDDQETVDNMVAAVQECIGDLSQADTGILFVVPVLQVYKTGNGIPNASA